MERKLKNRHVTKIPCVYRKNLNPGLELNESERGQNLTLFKLQIDPRIIRLHKK